MMILYLVKFAYSPICYARSTILLSRTNKLICNKLKCIILCFAAVLSRKLLMKIIKVRYQLGILRYEVVNDKKKEEKTERKREMGSVITKSVSEYPLLLEPMIHRSFQTGIGSPATPWQGVCHYEMVGSSMSITRFKL